MMVLGSMSALAGEAATATGKTITLTGGKAGHTYTIYQIFTGKVVGSELTDIQWGADAPDSLKTEGKTAASAAKDASALNNARTWAHGLSLSGSNKCGIDDAVLTADGNVVFSNVPEGYYVILDTNNNTSAVKGDYSSAIIVEVVDDVNGQIKGSAPTSEKKVKDTNDSDTTHTSDTYGDSADYDIGDAVPFQLRASTSDKTSTYAKYHITFQDNQSDGLNAPTAFTVNVLGKTIELASAAVGTKGSASTTDTTITAEVVTPDAGQDFAIKVTFEPTQKATGNEWVYLKAECDTAVITVDYTSVLNSNAKIGAEGNPNTSYIKYSSNPESKDDSDTHEGKTPEDTVIVFTYQPVIDKIDETGAALKGAGFTLYKQVTEGFKDAVKGDTITFGTGVEHSAIEANNYYVVVGIMTADASGATFSFKGIDDGTYVLVETTVPDGYNAWKSTKVVVTAEHSEGNDPKLTKLEADQVFTAANKDTGTMTASKQQGSKDVQSGELFGEIENNSGATLPETGGIGTTIFYVAGSILVLAAAILLITKRRMGAGE